MSNYLGIDLDTAGLYVVSGSAARGGTASVERAASWNSESGGPPPLTAESAKSIGEQLREKLKAAGIAPGPVLVAVGRDKVILKEVRFPAVAPSEEPALVRFQALKEITESPEDVVLDYAPMPSESADGERRALAVVLRKDVLAAVQTMCNAAGLKLVGVSPRPFAVAAGLTRAFAAGTVPTPPQPGDAVAVLTVGSAGGEFVVVRSGEVHYTRAVPAQVLANESLLVGQVRRDLAVYAGQSPTHPVKAVYVAEVGLGGWSNRLRTAVSAPVHAYDPLEGAVEDVAAPTRGRFAGAAGLLAGRAARTLPINFAAPRKALVESNPKKKLYLLAALAALVIVGVGGAFGWMQVSAQMQTNADLEADKAKLKKQILDSEPYVKQYEAVEAWQSREVVWPDELFDMTDRFPSDGLVLHQFTGTPILPDKNGKQDAQAKLELKLTAKRPESVDSLITVIEQDSGSKKFYRETQKTTQQEVYIVSTRVSRRAPTEFRRFPSFTTPTRILYSAAPPSKDDPTPKAAKYAENGNQ